MVGLTASHRRMLLAWYLGALGLLTSGCVRVPLPEAVIRQPTAIGGLSWQRAIEMGLAHHPDILDGRARVRVARSERSQALGALLPSASGQFSRTRSRTGGGATGDDLELGVGVDQPLFAGGALTGELLQAAKAFEAEQWAYRETSAALRRRLREAYVELLRLSALAEVNARIAVRRTDNAEMIRLR